MEDYAISGSPDFGSFSGRSHLAAPKERLRRGGVLLLARRASGGKSETIKGGVMKCDFYKNEQGERVRVGSDRRVEPPSTGLLGVFVVIAAFFAGVSVSALVAPFRWWRAHR